jgi:hypothetical protein
MTLSELIDQQFKIGNVLKIKGLLITCQIIYLLFITICIVFWKGNHVGYFKSVISTTLRLTVTIKLLNIYYSHTTVDRSYTTI